MKKKTIAGTLLLAALAGGLPAGARADLGADCYRAGATLSPDDPWQAELVGTFEALETEKKVTTGFSLTLLKEGDRYVGVIEERTLLGRSVSLIETFAFAPGDRRTFSFSTRYRLEPDRPEAGPFPDGIRFTGTLRGDRIEGTVVRIETPYVLPLAERLILRRRDRDPDGETAARRSYRVLSLAAAKIDEALAPLSGAERTVVTFPGALSDMDLARGAYEFLTGWDVPKTSRLAQLLGSKSPRVRAKLPVVLEKALQYPEYGHVRNALFDCVFEKTVPPGGEAYRTLLDALAAALASSGEAREDYAASLEGIGAWAARKPSSVRNACRRLLEDSLALYRTVQGTPRQATSGTRPGPDCSDQIERITKLLNTLPAR